MTGNKYNLAIQEHIIKYYKKGVKEKDITYSALLTSQLYVK